MKPWIAILFPTLISFMSTFAVSKERDRAAELLQALHRVQDELARGDLAAQEIQAVLSSELLSSLENPLVRPKDDSSWSSTAIGYSLNGASPEIVRRLLSRIPSGDRNEDLAKAVGEYSTGNMRQAAHQLEQFDLTKIDPRLAPYVALAAGTANLKIDPSKAMRSFEFASILAPGTLVEEVALRRLVELSAENQDAASLGRDTNIYIRRYSNSPFAVQFFSNLAKHLVNLLSNEKIKNIMSLIDYHRHDPNQSILFDFAYNFAITGKVDLLKYLVDNYFNKNIEGKNVNSIRSKLYNTIVAVSLKSNISGDQDELNINFDELTQKEKILYEKTIFALQEIYKPLSDGAIGKADSEMMYVSNNSILELSSVSNPDGESSSENLTIEVDLTAAKAKVLLKTVDDFLAGDRE